MTNMLFDALDNKLITVCRTVAKQFEKRHGSLVFFIVTQPAGSSFDAFEIEAKAHTYESDKLSWKILINIVKEKEKEIFRVARLQDNEVAEIQDYKNLNNLADNLEIVLRVLLEREV